MTIDQISIEVVGESENLYYLYTRMQDLITKKMTSEWFIEAVDILTHFACLIGEWDRWSLNSKRCWMLLINRKRRKKKAYDEHLFESIISKI